jgi:hypothetical protein
MPNLLASLTLIPSASPYNVIHQIRPILLGACERPSHRCDSDVDQELSCVGFQKTFFGVCPFLLPALIPHSIRTSQPEVLKAGTNPWCYCRRGKSFLMVDRRNLLRQSAIWQNLAENEVDEILLQVLNLEVIAENVHSTHSPP